jgi:hypothetical protein
MKADRHRGGGHTGAGRVGDAAVHERLAVAFAGEPAVRAPATLLGNVMEAVYRESLRGGAAIEEPAVAARAYRRIGWSFVLSAALVAAVLVAPLGGIRPSALEGRVRGALRGEGQSLVRSALVGADVLVQGALRLSAPAGGGR